MGEIFKCDVFEREPRVVLSDLRVGLKPHEPNDFGLEGDADQSAPGQARNPERRQGSPVCGHGQQLPNIDSIGALHATYISEE